MGELDAKKERSPKCFLRDKYFWVGSLFILWMIFFDTNSLMAHWKLGKDIYKMKSERDYLRKKIATEKDQLKKIQTNSAYLEGLARERFYMKRDDEDLFIVTQGRKSEKHLRKDR